MACNSIFHFRNLKKLCSLKHFVPIMDSRLSISLSARHGADEKLVRAVKIYIEKVKSYDKFIKEQFKEYELGKKHLANIMGEPDKVMTEEEINKAIEYLLPSGLFLRSARPHMSSPEKIFKKQKSLEMDSSGRPFNYLFYTLTPNYCQILHDAALHIETLNKHEANLAKQNFNISQPQSLNMLGSDWLSKEELESMLLEKLYDVEYEKFLEVLNCLAQHPYAYMVESFVKKYRKDLTPKNIIESSSPVILDDGSKQITIKGCRRGLSSANVKITYPGTGVIKINGCGIDYFNNIQCREQIYFPLLLTEMDGKVNVEATVENGGTSNQAGAIRLGISLALKALVPQEMALKMKLAGLLQRDFRRRERKKPGQRGARAKYTWLKR